MGRGRSNVNTEGQDVRHGQARGRRAAGESGAPAGWMLEVASGERLHGGEGAPSLTGLSGAVPRSHRDWG